MTVTDEDIEQLADRMVNRMSHEQLKQFVYEDLLHVMGECEDTYHTNLQQLESEEARPPDDLFADLTEEENEGMSDDEDSSSSES